MSLNYKLIPTEDGKSQFEANCSKCGEPQVFEVNNEDFRKFLDPNGPHVQDCFPYLSADQRELLLTHQCGKCFDALFADEEE